MALTFSKGVWEKGPVAAPISERRLDPVLTADWLRVDCVLTGLWGAGQESCVCPANRSTCNVPLVWSRCAIDLRRFCAISFAVGALPPLSRMNSHPSVRYCGIQGSFCWEPKAVKDCFSVEAWSRLEYSFTCFARCQGFCHSTFCFLNSFNLIFFPILFSHEHKMMYNVISGSTYIFVTCVLSFILTFVADN